MVYIPATVDPALETLGMLGDHPRLAAYRSRMQQRPAFQRAHAD